MLLVIFGNTTPAGPFPVHSDAMTSQIGVNVFPVLFLGNVPPSETDVVLRKAGGAEFNRVAIDYAFAATATEYDAECEITETGGPDVLDALDWDGQNPYGLAWYGLNAVECAAGAHP